MSFTFSMAYKPTYQKRYGTCAYCGQGIVKGARVANGIGFFHNQFIRNRLHWDCYMEAITKYAKEWFFANDYKPCKMSPETKAQLNRLRAKRYYIKKIGGENVKEKLDEVERQIAFVKAEKSQA